MVPRKHWVDGWLEVRNVDEACTTMQATRVTRTIDVICECIERAGGTAVKAEAPAVLDTNFELGTKIRH